MTMLVLPALLGLPTATAGSVSLTLASAEPVFTTDPQYVCFNIDTSENREFFTIDFTEQRLRYLAGQLGPAYLRVGGTGNDDLTYEFGSTKCKDANTGHDGSTKCKTGGHNCCLNQTQWDGLCGLAAATNTSMVFGLNILKRTYAGPDDKYGIWDPTNARELLQYSISKGYTFYGFELGNEKQGPGRLGNTTEDNAKQQAKDYATLKKLLGELYPNAASRPRLLGPDPTSLGNPGYPGDALDRRDGPILKYITSFAAAAKELDVGLTAITYHEYVEANITTSRQSAKLDVSAIVADSVVKAVEAGDASLDVWGGEIGPHNGGSPPCDGSVERYSTFADSFWYADALGAKALRGHKVFCRQDFVGADYGLIDCATHAPNPDYYVALLWGQLMGTKMLNLTSTDSSVMRSYAACTRAGAGVTLLLINLQPAGVDVTLPTQLRSFPREEYSLTGELDSQDVALNNRTLAFKDEKLPELLPVKQPASESIFLQGNSVTFAVLPGGVLPACRG